MFQILAKKISVIVNATLILCIVLSTLLSFLAIKNIILGNYTELSLKYTDHQYKTTNLYMKFIEKASKLVTQDLELITSLKSSIFDKNIVSILNGTRSTKLSIMGLSLFAKNGNLYTSGLASNTDRLSHMQQDADFIAFMASTTQTEWYLQFDADNSIYKPSIAFPTSGGVLTFVSKVKDTNGNNLGYLFIDTDINYYYQLYIQNGNSLFKNMGIFLFNNNGKLLSSPYNSSSAFNLNRLKEIKPEFKKDQMHSIVNDKSYFIIFNKVKDSDLLPVITISKKSAYVLILSYSIIIGLLSLGLTILSLKASKILTESIIAPIYALYSKMHGSINI